MRGVLVIIISGFLIPVSAVAQQSQTVAPSQASNAICANAISLAMALEQQQKLNSDLQKQLDELKHSEKEKAP